MAKLMKGDCERSAPGSGVAGMEPPRELNSSALSTGLSAANCGWPRGCCGANGLNGSGVTLAPVLAGEKSPNWGNALGGACEWSMARYAGSL